MKLAEKLQLKMRREQGNYDRNRDFAFGIYNYTNIYFGYKLTLITYLFMEN